MVGREGEESGKGLPWMRLGWVNGCILCFKKKNKATVPGGRNETVDIEGTTTTTTTHTHTHTHTHTYQQQQKQTRQNVGKTEKEKKKTRQQKKKYTVSNQNQSKTKNRMNVHVSRDVCVEKRTKKRQTTNKHTTRTRDGPISCFCFYQ